jgi:8-oxo-dGTP diphosphatase
MARGIILVLVETILRWAIKPLAIIYTLIKLAIVCRGKGKLFSRVFSRYLVRIAMAHDQADNTTVRFLFNDLLLKKNTNSYKFGNMDEKISSVLGKNQRRKTLNGLGRFVNGMLHVLEEDHSLNSIDDSVTDQDLPSYEN